MKNTPRDVGVGESCCDIDRIAAVGRGPRGGGDRPGRHVVGVRWILLRCYHKWHFMTAWLPLGPIRGGPICPVESPSPTLNRSLEAFSRATRYAAKSGEQETAHCHCMFS